jgi:hypothetical protein
MAGGQPEHLRTAGTDHDRDAARARPDRPLLEVPRCMERPFEVGPAPAQERHDDLEGLLESGEDMVLG